MTDDRKNKPNKLLGTTDLNFDEKDEDEGLVYIQRQPPLTVSYKTAGKLIDRSSRTIKRMVDRGDLDDLPGYNLITFSSLEDWVSRCRRSSSQPNSASTLSGAREL